MNTKLRTDSLGITLVLLGLVSSPVQAQSNTVPSIYALPSTAADGTKPGFIWHVSEVAAVGAYPQNSTARAEAQLAGLVGENLADPSAVGAAAGPSAAPNPSSAPIEFLIPSVINLDIASGHGNFADDSVFPGLPGTGGGNDNAAAEALTWLSLPAGDLVMGVNSDDGFVVTIGGGRPSDKVGGIVAGTYEGGRGAGDTTFTLHVSQAGLYAARLLWENGGGDASLEWFTLKADGSKVLVNDTSNGGIPAYQSVTGAAGSFVSAVSPDVNATGVLPNASVSAQIQDGSTAVVTNSIRLSFDGTTVAAEVIKSGTITTVTYTPSTIFASLSTHTVSLSFTDDANKTVQWSFTAAGYSSLPATLKVSPDTTQPGFVFQVTHAATLPGTWRNPVTGYIGDGNSNERTELQLAGLLLDDSGVPVANLANPAAKGVALTAGTAPTPAYAPIRFEIPTVINLSAVAGSTGNFTPDDPMPGAPGTDGTTDSYAGEIITYLDLPAGLITMGVNSDDGFRTQAGIEAIGSVRLGEYEGAREGGGDTLFTFFVSEGGVYPFRTTWENGTGGGANIEWFTVQNGKKVLLNDSANGGLKAYRAQAGSAAARITNVQPIPGMRWLNQESKSLQILVADGANPTDVNSISLTVNGQTNIPTATREGNSVRLIWTPTSLQIPTAVQTATLSWKDSTGSARSVNWQFRNLKNIVVPASALTENFDSTPEGAVPTGWFATNYTVCSGDFCNTPGEDLDNLNSDSYRGWLVVGRDRVDALKSRIFATVAPGQTVNGQPVDSLGSGNVLYAESDVRDGSQVQFLVSKAFDLSKVKHVTLTFESAYEQNQDNINSLEYSVDGGKSWLPLLYYLDGTPTSDIKLNPDGSVNATHTFKDSNSDTASWTDRVTGVLHGGKYGDFIAAPISEALAPYIVSRVNDNATEGKRVEVFRLWKADSQSDVRLRFAQGGTASWYWAIDNINFYDTDASGTEPGAGTASGQPTLSVQGSSAGLTLTFTGTLQSSDKAVGPYTDVNSATSPAHLPISGAAQFYRARQ